MVFNTGAALLDAVVLAVVSREVEGAYGYKITQDVRQVIELSESTLYPALKCMTGNVPEGTGGIIRLRKRAGCSLICMKVNGENILQKSMGYSREERANEQMGIYEAVRNAALRYYIQ